MNLFYLVDLPSKIFIADEWKRIIHFNDAWKTPHFVALILLIAQCQKECACLEANRTWTANIKSSYQHSTLVLLLWFRLASSTSSFTMRKASIGTFPASQTRELKKKRVALEYFDCIPLQFNRKRNRRVLHKLQVKRWWSKGYFEPLTWRQTKKNMRQFIINGTKDWIYALFQWLHILSLKYHLFYF